MNLGDWEIELVDNIKGRQAPNSGWTDGITYKGHRYTGPYAIHVEADAGKRVSEQTFGLRLSKRSSALTDLVIEECLYMPVREYQAKYSVRKSWVTIDGVKVSVADLFDGITNPAVLYPNFRQRILRLEKAGRLSTTAVNFAGAASEVDWSTEHGGGRRTLFTYEGELYPEHASVKFPSIAAFMKKIDRYEDRLYVRRRLAAFWEIDTALSEPVVPESDRSYRIYKVSRISDAKIYIGLTLIDAKSRFAQHVRKSVEGSHLPLNEAIRLDGSKAFTIEVIEDHLLADEVGLREKHWINTLNTLHPYGFNMTAGGQRGGGKGKPVEYQGEEFPSLEEAATVLGKRHNLARHVVIKRLSAGKPLPKKARKHSAHPAAGSSHYRLWLSMINRIDKKDGGTLDPAWQDYDRYLADVGYKPADKDLLVRIDTRLAWGPGNFEWISNQDWMDRMNGTAISVHGVEYPSLVAVAKAYKVGLSTLKNRLSEQAMAPEQAVAAPVGVTSRKGKPPIVVDGEEFKSMTDAAKQISARTGENPEVVRYRLRRDAKAKAS